jgi:hypothetical protein
MDTQLSYLIDGWVTTRPTISDLCHSALVSCDTISSERIAPQLAPDGANRPEDTRHDKQRLVRFWEWFGVAPPRQ